MLDLIQEGTIGLIRAHREVRLAPRLPLLDLRDAVDPPVDRPRARQPLARDPPARARRAARAPRRQGPHGARGRARPRADTGELAAETGVPPERDHRAGGSGARRDEPRPAGRRVRRLVVRRHPGRRAGRRWARRSWSRSTAEAVQRAVDALGGLRQRRSSGCASGWTATDARDALGDRAPARHQPQRGARDRGARAARARADARAPGALRRRGRRAPRGSAHAPAAIHGCPRAGGGVGSNRGCVHLPRCSPRSRRSFAQSTAAARPPWPCSVRSRSRPRAASSRCLRSSGAWASARRSAPC